MQVESDFIFTVEMVFKNINAFKYNILTNYQIDRLLSNAYIMKIMDDEGCDKGMMNQMESIQAVKLSPFNDQFKILFKSYLLNLFK